MNTTGEPAPARPAKSAAAYRTIGEVADDLDLPAHVLRFWESKFPQLKPLKRGGGRRYYRPEDIVLLRRIRQCLYQDGYTIRGVQKLLGDPLDDGRAERQTARPVPGDAAAGMPSLFPLDAASATDEPSRPARGPRPPRRRPLPPDTKAALQEIRRELLDVRALLDELARPKAS